MTTTRWTKLASRGPRIAALTIGVLVAPPAAADDVKVRCAAAYEQAQELRRHDRLTEARAQLLVCRAICSTAFALDCERWRAEVDAQLAAPAPRATSPVEAPAASPPPVGSPSPVGSPLPVGSPSPVGSPPPVESSAARARSADATAASRGADAKTSSPASVDGAKPSASPAVYILGATAIAAFGVAGGLSIKGHLDVADLRSSCAPRCDPHDVDAATRLYDIAWITAGVGVVSAAAAILIWQPWRRGPSTTGAAPFSVRF
ncbi:hypothetical protein [Pendulispora albinea]|uniref:Uncharacterized protein n=1 Tax=Pendulispora albinea TaxID=2741071 RepID=A0ABZ2LVR2_9BACT